MATLERAIEIAVLAHKGVSDTAGAPYVLHPLRPSLTDRDVERIKKYRRALSKRKGD